MMEAAEGEEYAARRKGAGQKTSLKRDEHAQRLRNDKAPGCKAGRFFFGLQFVNCSVGLQLSVATSALQFHN